MGEWQGSLLYLEVSGTSERTIKVMLKSFGLNDTEVEIYLFLSKHDPSKGTYIAKQLRKDKSQVYHILKTLQAKGLVESTLESPARYAPVALERIIDLTVKEKRDEAARIETTKQDLIQYWKGLKRSADDLALEKFVVIEEKNKIFSKFLQMVKETKVEFSSLLSTHSLLDVYRLGLFESIQEKSNNQIPNFRVLVELDEKELKPLEALLNSKPKMNLDLRGRIPDLGGRSPPNMAIRDDQELMFYVKSANGFVEGESRDVCFWTDSRVLVQSFMSLFRNVWQTADSVEDVINEVEASQTSPRIVSWENPEQLKKVYEGILKSAKEEIVIVATEEELMASQSNLNLLKDWVHKGIAVKIMAPIAAKNSNEPLGLPSVEIRKIAPGHLQTILVDCKHLFQARSTLPGSEEFGFFSHFQDAVYSNDLKCLEKTKNMLDKLWMDSSSQRNGQATEPGVAEIVLPEKVRYAEYKKMLGALRGDPGTLSEKELIKKIITAKKTTAKNWEDTITWYGSRAIAVVHPPNFFKLPDLVLTIYNANKLSSFGEEDFMTVNMWEEKAHAYLPVAVITDNPKGCEIRKRAWASTMAAQNFQCVKKDQFQIHVQGNTLFASWTVPIRLGPGELILPPACILFEGYGRVIPGIARSRLPSGRKVVAEFNVFEARATFLNRASEYSAPATEGLFAREIIVTSAPPT